MSSQSEPVNHSTHPHHLQLTNIHNGGLVRHDCNACRQQICGFSYRCGPCDFDLHITCASMPFSLTHQSHHHQLFLLFSPPYDNKHFTCNICRMMGYNHWLYRCESCGFDAHLGCIHSPNIQQTHTQSYQSTPTANLRYQAAGGTQQFPTGPRPPLINYNYPAGPPNNYVNHGHGYVGPSGGIGGGNNNNNSSSSSIMNQATQGLINGSTQSLAMYGVQASLGVGAFAAGTTNIWGGGGGGGDWGGDGGPSNDYGVNEASSF